MYLWWNKEAGARKHIDFALEEFSELEKTGVKKPGSESSARVIPALDSGPIFHSTILTYIVKWSGPIYDDQENRQSALAARNLQASSIQTIIRLYIDR